MAHLGSDASSGDMAEWDTELATTDDFERYLTHLETTLVEIGFLKPKAPKQLMTRLRRLYARTRLDKMEMNILRGILTSTQQVVENLKKGG